MSSVHVELLVLANPVMFHLEEEDPYTDQTHILSSIELRASFWSS